MSDQNDEFITFEKALRDLQMQSEELKKLVSEGEIRAFRDGDSMKFKAEDLKALRGDEGGSEEEQIVFEDALEDDTGMVTEEISAEDTLLAEDDLLEDDLEEEVAAPAAAPAARAASRAPSPRARAARGKSEMDEPTSEPMWVVALSVLASVLLLWSVFVIYNIASGATPEGLTGMFLPK